MKHLLRHVVSAVLLYCVCFYANAEQRLALVFGNESYADSPLANPANDAEDIGGTLEQLGFEVALHIDANPQTMLAAIDKFGQTLQANQDSVGVFYYAGHGISLKGINYLLPVNVPLASTADIEKNGINLDRVMDNLGPAKARLSFVILDACRNNPFGDRSKESLVRDGLSRMFAPSSTLIAYATTPGATASDGGRDNGLYTYHLVSNLKVPGLTAEQVFKRTRAKVELDSSMSQSPREESSLKGDDFYFLPLDQASDINPQVVELAHWQAISRSEDALDYQTFLEQHPEGKFAAVARSKLAKLEGIQASDPGLQLAGLAQTAIQRGELNGALPLFEKLTKSKSPLDQARGYEGLADIAIRNGDLAHATQHVERALSLRPKSAAALLIKAQIAHQQGDSKAVAELLNVASSEQSDSDFTWQRGLALVSKANVLRETQPKVAVAAYRSALQVDPHAQETVANLASLLRDTGDMDEALAVLEEGALPSNNALQALTYQIKQQMSERNDIERQQLIDQSVKDLMVQFKAQASRPASQDEWTTRPMSISVLGFQEKSLPLGGRVGSADLLTQELSRELGGLNMMVVDRALIDKILTELKLSSSDLADPETQLRLGKITAAQIIIVGNLYHMRGKPIIALRAIDTETSRVVMSSTERLEAQDDPVDTAAMLADKLAMALSKEYPVRGRIAMVEGDMAIINLGEKYGLLAGDQLQILSEPQNIEFNGKVLGKKQQRLGAVRVAAVDEGLSYVSVSSGDIALKENMMVELLRAPAVNEGI